MGVTGVVLGRKRALVCGHVAVGKVALSLSEVWCSCSLPNVSLSASDVVFGGKRAMVGGYVFLNKGSAFARRGMALTCSLLSVPYLLSVE